MKLSCGHQCISSPKLINPRESQLCCTISDVKKWFSYWLIDTCLCSNCIRFGFLINRDERSAEGHHFVVCGVEIIRASEVGLRWGVSQIFRTFEMQTILTHDKSLKFKNDGRPRLKVTLKNRTPESVYGSFSWICGKEKRNTFFSWPCLMIMLLWVIFFVTVY